jgi:hypothetical protein
MNGDTAPLPVIAEATLDDVLAACARLQADLEETRRLYRMAAAGNPDNLALVVNSNQLADKGWWLCTALEKVAENYGRATLATSVMDLIEQNPVPALAAVPEPRHRHRKGRIPRQRAPGEGQLRLFPVPGIALVAFAALKRAAPHLGHAALHPATWKLTGLKAAAAAAAVPAAGALVVGAVVISSPASPAGQHSAGSGPAPAASIYAAIPAPSSALIARTATHPKAKHAARGKTLLYAAEQPPLPGPAPQPSPSPLSPSASATASATGPAVLAQLPATLDLSAGAPVTLTLTATGSGWLSWHIDTSGTDLSFSPDHGVLAAGSSVTVTVSLALSLDSLTQQVFTIAGQQVTVSLPVPVSPPSAAPSVVPSAVTSGLPADLPSL